MAARMAAVGAALCVTLLLLLPAVSAFYLPGVAPLDLAQVRAFLYAIRSPASLAVFFCFPLLRFFEQGGLGTWFTQDL
jgi:hypothetical protein